ncbi:MAG TPA: ATP-binding protein [Myxococcota bacterium]|nr:ATP-binding protein [Myxococcota bacterium]
MIDLRELMLRESEQVEWKENVADINDVVRTLVAFANDLANLGGGRVVCGAKEAKDAHGFPTVSLVGMTADRAKQVRGVVVARCQANVAPSIAPVVDEVATDDPARRVLVFTVIATGRAHVLRDGDQSAHWVRIDHGTKEARNGVLMRLLALRGEVQPWDRRLAAGATVDDLDLLALRDALVQMRTWDPSRPIDHWLDPDVSVSTFIPSLCGREPLTGVVRPRNFAILLFGREPQRFVPGAFSSFSLYPGIDRTEPYSERVLMDGTILGQARQLIDRLNVEAVGVTDKSTGGADNVQKYPVRALQEAVINALVHRDYAEPHPVRVVAYSDRVDIWSPGGLDHRLDRDRFTRGDVRPVWRNQTLAWVFLKLQLAQGEGQGIPTIQRSLATEGSAPATFEVTEGSVACILPAHPRHARARDLLRIEDDVVHGRVERALATLEGLLAEDPFNFRTVALLTQIARSIGDAAPVLRFLRGHMESLHRFPAAAQLALADALLTSDRSAGRRSNDLARTLLSYAGQASKDLIDTRRYVINLLVLQDEQAALDALRSAFTEHPPWSEDPALLQLRGRTWLQFAKRTRVTLRDQRLTPHIRQRAQRELASHLKDAERDLKASLAHGAEGVVRDHAEDDLRFLERLREGRR